MAELIDDLKIANNALALIGELPIGAFEDESPTAQLLRAIYDDAIEWVMTKYRWSFLRQTVQLQRLAGLPIDGFAYAYQLPADRLALPTRYLADPRTPTAALREFMVEGDAVHAMVKEVWAVVPVRQPPALWPAYFRALATNALAARLARPVTHDSTLASGLLVETYGTDSAQGSGGMFGQAVLIDAMTHGPEVPASDTDMLTSAFGAAGTWLR